MTNRVVDKVKSWFSNNEMRAALAGVIVGAVFTGGISWITTNQSIHAQTAHDVREKRGDVYQKFRKATAAWVDLRIRQVHCSCVPAQQIYDVSSEFRDEVTQVRIFGSADAYAAAYRVGETIPDTWPGLGAPVAVDPRKSFNLAEFAKADTAFEHVMCVELPATPSSRCDNVQRPSDPPPP